MKKFIIIYFAFWILSSCQDVRFNDELNFSNLTNDTVAVLSSNKSHGNLTENNIAFYLSDYNIIPPNEKHIISKIGGTNAWHQYIQGGNNKKLYIFVFKIDTLKKYDHICSMDDLIDSMKYIKLMQFSESDLNKSKWLINYR